MAKNRDRVVVYGMNYAPEMAGVGRYTGEIAEHMARNGMDVTVVTTPPHYPGWKVQPGYAKGYSSAHLNGVKVVRTPLVMRERMGGIWRLLAPASFALTSAPVVFWQIVSQRPKTVLCVEPTLIGAPVARLAAALVGARTVLHVQDLEVDAAFAVGHLAGFRWLKTLGYAFESFTLRHFGSVITISNRMADRLVEKGVRQERLAVVRNWVDLSHIHPLESESPYRAELGFGQDEFIVQYSGNIGAKQGLGVLLDAAERLKGDARIRFVIAGEGPAKAPLAARYGHLANVRFLPFQPYDRLNEFLNMADLHVLPQDKGVADLVLPSKLGGMLASGKPVIVTADPDSELAEFVGDAATVTPPGDAERLAEAITRKRSARAHDRDAQIELARKLARATALDEFLAIAHPVHE